MTNSVKDNAASTSRQAMVEQCKSVLKAGGTVYLGESHNQSHAREICQDVLRDRCVQFFCIEYDTSIQEQETNTRKLTQMVRMLDGITQFNTKREKASVTMPDVLESVANDNFCQVVFIDNVQTFTGNAGVKPTKSSKRQRHMRDQIQQCRRSINKIGRGVLVLVGSDHLETIPSGKFAWDALHEIVYDGHSFTYGKYESCYMVWQLS